MRDDLIEMEECRQEETGTFSNILENREGAGTTECLKHGWAEKSKT